MTKVTEDTVSTEKIDRDRNILAFLKILNPTDNVTGGGTASAVAGAMAAALVAMVARLSTGKKGTKEDSYYSEINTEAKALSMELFAGGYQDSQAFEAVQASYKLPRETNEQKALREKAIERAAIRAAQVPLSNAEACARVLDLCTRLSGHSNPNAASDLECARHLARAGLLGCLANVEVNLPSIKDEKLHTEFADRIRALRKSLKQNKKNS
jgi:formiminotetrahydrofolate cyclodeaminase